MIHARIRWPVAAVWLLCGAGLASQGGWSAMADEPGPLLRRPPPTDQRVQPVPSPRLFLQPTIRTGPAVRQTVDRSGEQDRVLQQRLRDGDRILPPDWSDQGYIRGRRLEQTLLRPGEELLVHLERSLAPGSTLLIYRPGVTLTDPANGEVLGILAHTLGLVQITGESVENSWQARILTLRGNVQVGDRLLADQGVSGAFQRHTQVPLPVVGRILSLPDEMETAGAGQVVIVGVGRRDRVAQGLVLTIHHAAPPGVDPVTGQVVNDALHPIGEATLFLVGEKASFALLGPTFHPVVRGDTVASH